MVRSVRFVVAFAGGAARRDTRESFGPLRKK